MGCGASAKGAAYESKKDEAGKDEPTTAAADAPKEDSTKSFSQNAKRFSEGDRVQIGGLTGSVNLNGCSGIVCGENESSGRYIVELDDGGGQKSLRPENLTRSNPPTVVAAKTKDVPVASEAPKPKETKVPKSKVTKQSSTASAASSQAPSSGPQGEKSLEVGDRVRVGGLNGAIELNGKIAVVFSYDKSSQRYLVEFEEGSVQKKLKGDNLVPMGVATGAVAAKARMFAAMQQQ